MPSSTTSAPSAFNNWSRQVRLAIGWALVLALLGSIGTVLVSQSGKIAFHGRHAGQLQQELFALQRANSKLLQEIANTQSLTHNQSRAKTYDMEFVTINPINIEYVEVRVPAPISETNTVTAEEVILPDTIREALWITLSSGFNRLFEGQAGE